MFHDMEERVKLAAAKDARVLAENEYSLRWLRQDAAVQTLYVSREGLSTRLDRVADSDFRFFATLSDSSFGYIFLLQMER